jgi:hypothetical protein
VQQGCAGRGGVAAGTGEGIAECLLTGGVPSRRVPGWSPSAIV